MDKSSLHSPALFKATIDAAVERLAGAQPLGFCVADVASAIGNTEPTVPLQRRIRQRLTTLCARGALVSPDRGIYLASRQAFVGRADGKALLGDLTLVFFSAGGFMRMPEILEALGLEGRESERRVRTVLSESTMFERFNPIEGTTKYWRLADAERATVPVSGRWMAVDLQLTIMRMGGGRIPWRFGLDAALAAYRSRIATALRDARTLWNKSPEELIISTAIGERLDHCLSWSVDLPFVSAACPDDSGCSVAEWWEGLKTGVGMGEALAEAWWMLERDGGHPCLFGALDVATWVAIGNEMKLDPALLSRGTIAFEWRSTTAGAIYECHGTGT